MVRWGSIVGEGSQGNVHRLFDDSSGADHGFTTVCGWTASLEQWRTLLAMAKIPYFTMKHCAHWNGPFEGWREDPEKRGARNSRDLHRHTAQVTTKVTFRLSLGFFEIPKIGGVYLVGIEPLTTQEPPPDRTKPKGSQR